MERQLYYFTNSSRHAIVGFLSLNEGDGEGEPDLVIDEVGGVRELDFLDAMLIYGVSGFTGQSGEIVIGDLDETIQD